MDAALSLGWAGILCVLALLGAGLSSLITGGWNRHGRAQGTKAQPPSNVEDGVLELARECMLKGEISPEAYEWIRARLGQ